MRATPHRSANDHLTRRRLTLEFSRRGLDAPPGEVQEAVDMAFLMAGEGRRLYGVTTPSELPNKLCMTLREPAGVCGLVTPWNFPVAIPSWKSSRRCTSGDSSRRACSRCAAASA